MSYVIVTDSRKKNEILFMVDRSKQKSSFWSDRLDEAFIYNDRIQADNKARSLRYNNPRIMEFKEAISRVGVPFERTNQETKERQHQEVMDEIESGWDGHKQ